jgi:protein-S-isoprenylcysteine O-methyltransferase Ste14
MALDRHQDLTHAPSYAAVMSSRPGVRGNPLFADATSAVIGTATVAALVAMEVADGAVRRAAGDQVRDDGTARLFGAAMAVGLGTAGASLARPNRRVLPRNGAYFRIGAVLTWAGIGLNRWARRSLSRNYRPLLTVVADHEVVDRGPYRVVRHPMYLGSTMICAGVALALGTWPAVAAWALPPAALVHRVTVEERMLAMALGNRYEQYASTRPRMFPAVW